MQWADLSALRGIFAEIDSLVKTNEEPGHTSDEYRMRLFEPTEADEGAVVMVRKVPLILQIGHFPP